MRRRRSLARLAVLLVALLVASGCTGNGEGSARIRDRGATGEAELAEQAELTDQRLEALDEARLEGSLGRIAPVRRDPAAGWAGERLLNPTADDWEPAIAADPDAPYVYVLHNRYGGERACRNCPDPAMILRVSKDGGRTFGRERFLCECRGIKGQYDPLIEVVPETGDVVAAWMNGWKIVSSRSTDHGRTWSAPGPVLPGVKWGDKPILATSADGADVYVAFNGPTGGDPYVAASHDGGTTWSPVRAAQGDRYTFAYGGHVAADGTVVFTEVSFSYTGPDHAAEGPIQIHTLVSTDGGSTWTNTVVDTLELGTPCTSKGCYADFYDSGPALAADANDHLVMVYNGAVNGGGPRVLYARSSTDDGATWSDRVRLSRSGVDTAFPAAVGTGDGEVRIWYMDRRTGAWNVWYRTSDDLGLHWTRPVRISDAISGTAYVSRAGFVEVYGDYGEIAITSDGRTVATWGEGISYAGPGGVWFNRQR